ncbi:MULTISPECIES: acetoacetyl-CoA reductase [Thalassospira]|jgi:acetoacetyl-CoA reductase|uniref:acetoacetyl-CoA reductase n=1 Tax=Thalassospira TaxID=168934 RepID=UPI00080F79C0|nr:MULTISPECIES: acetoacetyl-CoA reductase [Thalassospira]MAB31471.1 beta-ketoacyl-ACP reductase [Thalassospira sp.]MBA05595.1 beta-ketoacyl-ACP reductase [Thalassospira sp.]MDM7974551.1 acetoacetyl-CoA reductase [Thalassospira xiamenensis]OCK06133.1 acetoacetyl-CoA reductase [Thalassospira sp. KO164]OHZ02109.1 beta-ketoacyl-ACP reductase [Thalassospira sp. MIT1004]|tara:strand:+ start:691 stop:1413 length:723 start_codon:yes stop_codon:yes gene_type:complete
MTKTALVTGGTRGIGKAISLALKEAGHTVVANYAGNDDAARAFTEETGIATFKWSVADADACADGIRQVESEVGPVDILVNNAGITRDGFMHKMSVESWHSVIETNLSSLFYMTKPVLEGMRERGFGRVVNISSINGQAGQFGQTNYSAAKAGVHGFTKALAQEVARKGVTVNTIAPGYINTDMVAAVPEKVLEGIIAKIPVGRLGEAEEIAQAVLFLCGPNSGFITGSCLSLNGGQHMF